MEPIAKSYIDQGWAVLPVPHGAKRAREDWASLTYGPDDFAADDNIAGKCGTPSADRVIIDCDTPEAVAAARLLLPQTEVHGRPGNPDSHYIYICPNAKSQDFTDVKASDGKSQMLVQLLSTGKYVMLPPSQHPSGDVYTSVGRDPLVMEIELLRASVTDVAVVALILRHWSSLHHSDMGHLAGFLLQSGVPPIRVRQIARIVSQLAPDHGKDILDFTDRTIEKFENGDSDVTGAPKLTENLGEAAVAKLRQWLGSKKLVTRHTFLDEADLLARPAAPWLVQDLIVEGGFVQFVGQPGSFKTFAAFGLAAAIADDSQTEYFGRKVNAHGTVVYVVAEGIGRFKYRVMAWKAEHGMAEPLAIQYLDGSANLREAAEMDVLVEEIAGWSPKLVVFDTQSRNTPGADENSSKDMNEVIAACDRLRTKIAGLTVLLVHHPRKDGQSERGHSNIRGALDGQFWFEITDKVQGLVKLRADKVKDADGNLEIELKRKIVQLDDTDPNTGEAITSCVLVLASAADVAKASASLDRKILELVQKNPDIKKGDVHGRLGLKKDTVAHAVDQLVLDGRLTSRKGGRGNKAVLLTFVSFAVSAQTLTF